MSFVKFLISKSFFKNAFLIVVVSGLLLVSLILFLNLNTKHGDFVVVPDLIGKTINQFEEDLSELNLKYVVSDSGNFNPEFKINAVLDQSPKANSKVKDGRKIYLTLNASDFEMVQIPKITGITVRQARKTIESLGFVFGEIEYVDDIARDEVISITNDSIELKEGDFLKKTSIIDFKLGNGKQ
jgi:beta-lactam-binding protein with PASTA domain